MFLKLNETATAQMTRYAKDTGYLFIYLLFILINDRLGLNVGLES